MEIEIQRAGLEGQGVGYDDSGNIYFVAGALPGDRVKVAFTETRKRYRDAELLEVVRPSPERRDPECAYFQQCGGCDWLHWDYQAQLKAKEGMLSHVLERALWSARQVRPIRPAKRVLGYRNRIQLRQEAGRLGFLRKRSHEIVDIEQCRVAHPALNEAMSKIRSEGAALPHRRKIELSVTEEGGVAQHENSAHAAGGFVQINTEQNEVLKEVVADTMARAQAHVALELFCGNGNLTYAFLPTVQRVMAVDSSREAIAAARAAKPPGMEEKVAFFDAFVGPGFFRSLPPDFRNYYDTLLLDPPRTGMARDLERWVTPSVRNVVYVSCSPATFVQDVTGLKKDFHLEMVQAVDMFPQTRHIEFVAWFQR